MKFGSANTYTERPKEDTKKEKPRKQVDPNDIQTMDKRHHAGGGWANDVGKLASRFTGWQTSDPSFCIDIAGDAGYGKTHLAISQFPKAALGDTEDKGYELMKKIGNPRYMRLTCWEDVLTFVYHCIEDPEVESIVIDSAKDIIAWAEVHYLADPNGMGKYQTSMWYGQVNAKIYDVIHDVRMSKKNLVFTSRMKDNYENDKKTGLREVDGFKHTFFQFDCQIVLRRGLVYKGKNYGKDIIYAEITKNSKQQLGHYCPYILPEKVNGSFTLTYEMIKHIVGTRVDDARVAWEEYLAGWARSYDL